MAKALPFAVALAVIAGSNELEKSPPTVQLKDLRTQFGEAGKQIEVALDRLVDTVRELLGSSTEA